MTENQKTLVTTGAVVGAFLLGWWLHKQPAGGGNVTLHFVPSSVQYDAEPEISSTYLPADAIFEPGEYTVNMQGIGG